MAVKKRTRLTSLERLERQLRPITPSRAQGDAWEKALKGWINAGGHPELTKAWMWGEWPGKLKAGLKGDKGVDLVAETRDKQLVAIQVKFRRDPNDPVTAPEVQKLVGSYRKHFSLFALASNALSATRGVSEAVGDEDAMLILREQLLESSYDWAAKKSIKRTAFTPFPFQKVAAENVRKALAKGGSYLNLCLVGLGTRPLRLEKLADLRGLNPSDRASNWINSGRARCTKHSAGDALSWEADALPTELLPRGGGV